MLRHSCSRSHIQVDLTTSQPYNSPAVTFSLGQSTAEVLLRVGRNDVGYCANEHISHCISSFTFLCCRRLQAVLISASLNGSHPLPTTLRYLFSQSSGGSHFSLLPRPYSKTGTDFQPPVVYLTMFHPWRYRQRRSGAQKGVAGLCH